MCTKSLFKAVVVVVAVLSVLSSFAFGQEWVEVNLSGESPFKISTATDAGELIYKAQEGRGVITFDKPQKTWAGVVYTGSEIFMLSLESNFIVEFVQPLELPGWKIAFKKEGDVCDQEYYLSKGKKRFEFTYPKLQIPGWCTAENKDPYFDIAQIILSTPWSDGSGLSGQAEIQRIAFEVTASDIIGADTPEDASTDEQYANLTELYFRDACVGVYVVNAHDSSFCSDGSENGHSLTIIELEVTQARKIIIEGEGQSESDGFSEGSFKALFVDRTGTEYNVSESLLHVQPHTDEWEPFRLTLDFSDNGPKDGTLKLILRVGHWGVVAQNIRVFQQ